MPTARIDGRRIAWREAGCGPPVLLLHCALAHSGAWGSVMTRLAPRFDCRALDLPGHGGTDAARGSPQEEAATDATALLAASRPAHLVGHSFGATVALRLAVEVPALVRSLVLIEPVMFAFLADAGDHAAHEAERVAHAPFARAAEAGDWEAAAESFLARWGAPAAPTGPQRDSLLARIPFIADSAADLHDAPARRLRLDDLATIACPVLLLAGSASPPVVHSILDAIASRLPGARRHTIPGAGHMLPVTHADAVAAEILRFLRPEDAAAAC